MTWQDKVNLAEHYLAVGQNEQSIYEDGEPKPWELVAEIIRHDYHGFDGNNSVAFIAPHACGLTFRWTVNIINFMVGNERRTVNTVEIQQALTHLKGPILDEFKQHLQDTRIEATKELLVIADEYKSLAGKISILGMLIQ